MVIIIALVGIEIEIGCSLVEQEELVLGYIRGLGLQKLS